MDRKKCRHRVHAVDCLVDVPLVVAEALASAAAMHRSSNLLRPAVEQFRMFCESEI